MHLDDGQYAQLLDFRDGLRRFLRWSEQQAKAAGLTPAQHQLLLAIRGHGDDPTIGDLAGHLLLRHHSTVELVDRAEAGGLVRRDLDPTDHRIVHVRLTRSGRGHLAELSAAHLEELERLAPSVKPIWAGLA
ncbi:MAG TPA: MarR family winged helix-turn-helix transcriptional regulator [Acidimicrobiales bacterium]|nr:MarR family winged helix-turn-helix transcriptional regulator [Acidimicrobiales bacterium]